MISNIGRFLLIVSCTIIHGSENDIIKPNQAIEHIGQYKTIKGLVTSTKYLFRSKGEPTFLNLDGSYPNQIFTIVIWGDDRNQFPEDPEYYYKDKTIMVSGKIIEYKGIAEIILNSPKNIRIVD